MTFAIHNYSPPKSNSKNSVSVKVTSGVYILKLKVENSQIIKKMVLLK